VTNSEANYCSDQAGVSLTAAFPEAIAGNNYENKWHHVAIGYDCVHQFQVKDW